MKCWHCCIEIPNKTKMYYLPIDYRNDQFICSGQFCCLNCVKAYIIHSNLLLKKNDCIHLLYQFYSELIAALNITNINCSPPREMLKDFGGTYTYEDYHKISITCNVDFNLSSFVVHTGNTDFLPNLDESTSRYKKLRSVNGQNFIKSKPKVLLKRSKPLKKIKHVDLQESMGIKVLKKN